MTIELRKLGPALAAVATVATVGSVFTVSAAKNSQPADATTGYTKDQCKNGGWQTFKNPDGSPMFKNQGDCVSFFATGGKNPPSGH
jgi:hypothetical protein